MTANDVNIGDKISILWMDGTIVDSPVTEICEGEEFGLCCPVTLSGLIIVDSVACSCYSPPTNLVPISISHGMCHAVMAPLRLRYAFGQSSKAPAPVGIHPYARLLMTAATGAIFS